MHIDPNTSRFQTTNTSLAMYVTRPLSLYLSDPKALAAPPPEGPGSGILVVLDEAAEQASTHCWGLCLDRELRRLPFTQSRQLALRENNSSNLETCGKFVDLLSEGVGRWAQCHGVHYTGARAPGAGAVKTAPDYVVMVPVVAQPLSSGRYYVVQAVGKHAGKVSACSKEEDKTSCCFGSCVNDVKPRVFDLGDVYQQVEVQQLPSSKDAKGFKAVAVAGDGIPPQYLRKKGWKANTMASSKRAYDLAADAQGVDAALRRRMPPDLDGGLAVVVGRWHVPFMFVKADGGHRSLKDQFRHCTFYKMTLEQSWEQIYSSEAAGEVTVTATVRRSTALLGGAATAAKEGGPQVEGGTAWFRPAAAAAADVAVGLDVVVWERMNWELGRGGWVVAPGNNGGGEERIERVERRGDGDGTWRKFACYLLVERFVLRRMDGSLALTCEFRHTDKIRTKWV